MSTDVAPRPRPALLRQLGVTSAIVLVVSSMIGTGIFTTTGFLAGDLGSFGVVLFSWVVGAACALFGALDLTNGGESVYRPQPVSDFRMADFTGQYLV